MAGSVVPINPGPPTQLSGSNLNDMTLYNMSQTGAIWVGNSPSVAPNTGMRIGPLGTAHWSKDSGVAYACVDTGILTTINLNISNDITNPSNPVDVATATSLALLSQGIPNVLVETVLYNGTLTPGQQAIIDTSGQASVVIEAGGSTNLKSVFFATVFQDTNTGNTFDAFWLSMPANANAAMYAAWEMPVTAGQLVVTNGSGANAQNTTFTIHGSNRPVTRMRQLLNQYMPRNFVFNGNVVGGQIYTMTSGDNLPDVVTRFNGPIKLTWYHNNGASINAQPTLFPTFADSTGVLQPQFIFPPATGNTTYDWYHPSVPILWRFNVTTTQTSIASTLMISPAGSGY